MRPRASQADAAGYPPMLATAALLSLAGCLTLVRALDAGWGPARLRAVWTQA